MKKLPVGIYSFEFIRRHDHIYVDKTRHIYEMITNGMFYFMSRPRRFGKSLLVTTLWNLFAGRKDLFEGLWIAEHGDWAWEKHPIILLDFNGIPGSTPEELRVGLLLNLQRIAEEHGIISKVDIPAVLFQELILELYKKTKTPVVILIDEYDKRIIDHLGQGDAGMKIAHANRAILKQFFGVLKDTTVASSLRFVFLTGVSKFSKVSIFSELNNLNDLTMQEKYADMLGYTQTELESYFSDYITQLAEKLGWTLEQVKQELARHYNGYRFSDREIKVYNPFSILKAFDELNFKNHWFETGTPTFLVNLLREQEVDLPSLEGAISDVTVFSVYDIDHLQPEALMFQTGYLTIKAINGELYSLDYPNYEVKTSFGKFLLYAFAQRQEQKISSHVLRLAHYLQAENFETFFESMTAIFAAIPYDIQTKRDEAYYHTIFYLMMSASGGASQSSLLTCDGRIDLVVTVKDKVYIMEFKCNQSAAIALQQIKTQGYADRYRGSDLQIISLGINFSSENRNITEWQAESKGVIYPLDSAK